tara:strand:+ start:28 stop:594 length:567 start_codon:yes stop_codon:yes gene_type:complete
MYETNSKLLLISLERYYSIQHNMDELLSILNNKSISLRIIDWFVANYSKKNASQYIIYKDLNGESTLRYSKEYEIIKQVNVYHTYKCQLKSFSKKNFDPFCRRNRLTFNVGGVKINTTIGQLNFFKWANSILLIDFIKKHYKDIETDMNISYNSHKNKSIHRKKRQELSISASRGLTRYKSPIKVTFD